jgi:guanylate kinase
MKGKLILLVGVPGAGKSTLTQYARETFSELVFPSSWTTRAMRPGEVNGKDYHFVSDEEFTKAIEEEKFLEWVTIDSGRRYGTPKIDIISALEAGKYILREVEPMGARRIQELLPGLVATIFVTAGSWEEMAKRIRARAPIEEEEFAKRRERYERELSFEKEADYVVTNADGELEEAKQQLSQVLRGIMGR